ncbi:hypothetical protein ACVWW2_004871 [Bradyrhizobium sp. LM4.3]
MRSPTPTLILSIVPPGEAVALAERLAGLIVRREKKPVVVDCNAVNVDTVKRIEEIISSAQAPFVDAGIIGFPPQPGGKSPAFYMSGEHADEVAVLKGLGLDVRIVEGPVGAASALKMSYAGIVKGLAGIGAAMVVAATKAGAADALRDELAMSQPAVLARLEVALPDMIPKAYRWGRGDAGDFRFPRTRSSGQPDLRGFCALVRASRRGRERRGGGCRLDEGIRRAYRAEESLIVRLSGSGRVVSRSKAERRRMRHWQSQRGRSMTTSVSARASVRSKVSPEKLPSTTHASPAIASVTRVRKLALSDGFQPGRQ